MWLRKVTNAQKEADQVQPVDPSKRSSIFSRCTPIHIKNLLLKVLLLVEKVQRKETVELSDV